MHDYETSAPPRFLPSRGRVHHGSLGKVSYTVAPNSALRSAEVPAASAVAILAAALLLNSRKATRAAHDSCHT